MICTSSYEAQVFRNNLDILIKDNIQETGFDPRIGGPPEHIASQEVKNHDAVNFDDEPVVVERKEPHYWQTTQSLFKRRYQVCKSEMARMKRASFDDKIEYSKTRLKGLLDKFSKLEESMDELRKLNRLMKSEQSCRGASEDVSLKHASTYGSTFQFEGRMTKSASMTSFKSSKNLPGQHGFGYLSNSPVRQKLPPLLPSQERKRLKFLLTISEINFKPQPRPI